MPRAARIKSKVAIFHVMARSINDSPLFYEDKDKNYFLNLIKGYQEQFGFKVYAYCIMTTHFHIIINANGADISKIMQGINQRYAQYFNRKYKRHGHVFSDRFKSKVVQDHKYLITLSAYIHNNPKDMKKYKNQVEMYLHSSLGVYLGIREDIFGILDKEFILQLFSEDTVNAKRLYLKLVRTANEKALSDAMEFKDEKSQYRSEKVVLLRNFTADEVMNFVAKYAGVDKQLLKAKYNKSATEARALCVFMMRYLCDYTQKKICENLGYITLSRISSLCFVGLKIVQENDKYKYIVRDFIREKSA